MVKRRVKSTPKRKARRKRAVKKRARKKPPRALVLAESLMAKVEELEARIEAVKRVEAELRKRMSDLENKLVGSLPRAEYEAGLAKLRSTVQDVDSRLTQSVDFMSETVRSALQDVESKLAETTSRAEVESRLDDLAMEISRLAPRGELEFKLSESGSKVERRIRELESRMKAEIEKLRSALKEPRAQAPGENEGKHGE